MSSTMITDLHNQDTDIINQLAPLLFEAFKATAPNWLPTVAVAKAKIDKALQPGNINRVLLNSNKRPLGWIGVIPDSDNYLWEIHPLVVAVNEQGKGYGRRLVQDIEALAHAAGVFTLHLGTSDETNATTLSNIDLFTDPLTAMANLRTLKPHPYDFYVKLGFKLVGIMPNAEGPGQPGITMAKPICDLSGH